MNYPGQYAVEEERGNAPEKNEEAESTWQGRPVVVVSGGESKVQSCKEQYLLCRNLEC